MSAPTAWLRTPIDPRFGLTGRLVPILEILEYQPAERAYPNGRVLLVGRGQCPLWFDAGQVVVRGGAQ